MMRYNRKSVFFQWDLDMSQHRNRTRFYSCNMMHLSPLKNNEFKCTIYCEPGLRVGLAGHKERRLDGIATGGYHG